MTKPAPEPERPARPESKPEPELGPSAYAATTRAVLEEFAQGDPDDALRLGQPATVVLGGDTQ